MQSDVDPDTRPRPDADQWRSKPRNELSLLHSIGKYVIDSYAPRKDKVKTSPQGKIPVVTPWTYFAKYAPRAVFPICLRYIFMKVTGLSVSGYILYPLLVIHSAWFAGTSLRDISANVEKYGYLDAGVPRDTVPQAAVGGILSDFTHAVYLRLLLLFLVTYDRDTLPSLSLWLPVQLFVFTLTLDFIYYWFHRMTHEVDWLWKFHKKHHTTKHPNPFLTAYADEIQNVFDIIGTPTLAFLLFPLPFDTLYFWSLFFIAVETAGHSGIRLNYTSALTGFFFPIRFNIAIEDHDLHHRYGWGRSFNYGKQTMFWDHLFGTKSERLEMHPTNIAWDHHVPA